MPKNEVKNDSDPNLTKDQDHETETEEESEEESSEASDESSSSEKAVDVTAELRGLKAQLERLNERNTYLEKSLTLQDKLRERDEKSQKDEDDGIPADLRELDRTLDPVFTKRMKSGLDPLVTSMANQEEKLDAMGFKFFLRSEHPEILESESELDRLYQDVDQVRRNAASRGAWLSREEAFAFVEGVKARKERTSRKSEKKTKSAADEKKRKIDAKLADSEEKGPSFKVDPSAGIREILEKARRGERLSEDEGKKRFEYLRNAQF